MSRPSTHYNTNKSKSLYLKKTFDSEIPTDIMRFINSYIDSYNSNIVEKVKNSIDNEFEEKINDSNCAAGRNKESKSCQKSDREMNKYEDEIIKWLSFRENDQDFDYFSTKISKMIDINKKYLLVRVNPLRNVQKKPAFNPDYKKPFIKQAPTPFIKSSPVPTPVPVPPPFIKSSVPEPPKVVEKVYKDAWDDHFS